MSKTFQIGLFGINSSSGIAMTKVKNRWRAEWQDIKSVVVGMGVTGMHTINETVSIPDLVDSSNLCQELILSNC